MKVTDKRTAEALTEVLRKAGCTCRDYMPLACIVDLRGDLVILKLRHVTPGCRCTQVEFTAADLGFFDA